jgi:hypothetical protein
MSITTALFSAACSLFGSGCDLPMPKVEHVSQEWLQEHACPSGRCGRAQFWGWYNDEGTIYVWADAPPGPHFDSVVVHEIIHYLQHAVGDPAGHCQRERQAYALQDHYLTMHRGFLPPLHPFC